MNEREQLMIARIMDRAYNFNLSKYHYLFLSQMAIRQYELKRKNKTEAVEKTATKIMQSMPKLCKNTEGLKHKNIIQVSADKSLQRLEEELSDSKSVPEKLFRGDIVENVLQYLIKE